MAEVLRLDEALARYAVHLRRRPISENTRKAFWGDLNLFVRFLTHGDGAAVARMRVSDLRASHIRAFLEHEERRRGANSPKSLERRLTSLKVFFRWLHESGYLAHDPAEGIPYRPAPEPLPAYLTDAQAEAVMRVAHALAHAPKPDTRPWAIIQLILETGVKKSECLRLTRDDVDLGERLVHVRYAEQRLKFKERSLPISRECVEALRTHIERTQPIGRLFTCTGRNLEYIFNRRIAPEAGLSSLTFEMLRWTCALRDYRAGEMHAEAMQHKFGLSPVGWSEMEAKLVRLLAQARAASADAQAERA